MGGRAKEDEPSGGPRDGKEGDAVCARQGVKTRLTTGDEGEMEVMMDDGEEEEVVVVVVDVPVESRRLIDDRQRPLKYRERALN